MLRSAPHTRGFAPLQPSDLYVMQEISGPSICLPCPIAQARDPERRDEGTLDTWEQQEDRPGDRDCRHGQRRPEGKMAERDEEGDRHQEGPERQDGQPGRAVIGADRALGLAAMVTHVGLFQIGPENPPLPAFRTAKAQAAPDGGHQARRWIGRGHDRIRPSGGGPPRPQPRGRPGGYRPGLRPAHAAGSAFR